MIIMVTVEIVYRKITLLICQSLLIKKTFTLIFNLTTETIY